MNFNLDIINIVILFVMIVNSVYGLIIYSGKRTDKINFSFFILTISISMWGLTMFGYRGFVDHDVVLLMSRLLYFSAVTIPVAFLYFVFIFPDSETKLKPYQKYLVPIAPIVLCVLSLVPYQGGFISDVILYENKETFIVFNQVVHILFGLYVASYFSWAYWIVFNKFMYAKGELRLQLIYIFIGTLSSTMITLVTNLGLLYFGYFAFNWVGQIGIIVMISLIFYSIVKFRLFNIKVVATEIFVFALWAFILVRFFLSQTTDEKIINAILFAITVFVGVFLIRSVIKEVRQREKIEKLAGDLKKANTRLLELDKQKSEFVSFATHQLRAPLTAMKGYASLIMEGELGVTTKEVKEAIGRIFDSSKTLANIVDDYLNISRIELGTMKYGFENINMKDMVESVIGELKPNIDRSKLEWAFVTQPADPREKFMIHADKDKLKQVVANLIDNSVKYTPKGSLEISLTKDIRTRKVLFAVKDTGVGIAPEVMPKLFSKFVRAENANRQNIYGTGLGLFVAKEIVGAHKGRIWAESDGEGKGSQFYLEMDMAE